MRLNQNSMMFSQAPAAGRTIFTDIYLHGSDERRYLGSALNDVVLHPGSAAQMIEFELFIDDVFVYSQESDGLIIATPTGSTAYAYRLGANHASKP